jgi:hypothetical protein
MAKSRSASSRTATTGRWHSTPADDPFAHDVGIRRDAEVGNHITSWVDVDRGGHFAALGEPTLMIDNIREFFQLHRTG